MGGGLLLYRNVMGSEVKFLSSSVLMLKWFFFSVDFYFLLLDLETLEGCSLTIY